MAATTDLTNPITLPNGLDTANNNPIARSDKIIRQGKSQNVETGLTNIESAILGWNFDTSTLDGSNPGTGNVALNNIDKDLATIISFNTTSAIDSARFDELLSSVVINDRIYLQERDASNVSILFRVTGPPVIDGTKVNIPVSQERNQGPSGSTFTDGAFIITKLFFSRTADSSQSPVLTNLVTLDSPLNKDKVIRLNGNGGFIAGLSLENESQIQAIITRRDTTGTVKLQTIWYQAAEPTQAILDTFVVNPPVESSWIRINDAEDGIPPVEGQTTVYTVVTESEVLLTGIASGTGPSGSTFSEVTNLTLSGYHIYRLSIPSASPLVPSNTVDFDGGVTTFVAIGLVDSVKISEENLSDVDLNISPELSGVLSHLLGGATIEIDRGTDRVDVTEGFSRGLDYRDMVPTGTLNDDTHYVGDGVTPLGNAARYIIGFSGNTSFMRLLGFEINIDTTRTGTGAMIGLDNSAAVEFDFMNIAADRTIQIVTNPGSSDPEIFQAVQDQVGNVVLADNTNYWMLFEFVPRPGVANGFELLVVLESVPLTGDPVRIEANIINIDLSSVDPAFLGVSRSSSQIGQITQFKFISHPNYISHSNLQRLLDDHRNDKWCFGYARLFEGSDQDRVTLASNVELVGHLTPNVAVNLPDGSQLNGENLVRPELVVYLATGTGTGTGELVNSVALPANYTDYKYIHITEYDSTNLQWRHAEVTTEIFSSSRVGVNDSIRLQGNSVLDWTAGTRTLTLGGGAQEIYRISLKD